MIRAARLNRPKAERIHDGQRSRTHGKDVAQNAAYTRCRALKRLNVAGMIVRLDLECTAPTVPHVDDARVLSRPLDHAVALGGQALEMHTAGLVRAMLAPHDRINAQFGERRYEAKSCQNAVVFMRR